MKNTDSIDVNFIVHELNQNTQFLLNSNRMDYVIGHDVEYELKKSIELIENFYKNYKLENVKSNILIFNKHNCPNL